MHRRGVAILALAVVTILLLWGSDRLREDASPRVAPRDIPSVDSPGDRTFGRYPYGAPLSTSSYDVIAAGNIFRPLGWTAPQPRTRRPDRAAVDTGFVYVAYESKSEAPRPQVMTLTGIVTQDGARLALMDDDGLARFLRVGDTLANAYVREISGEHVVFAVDGISFHLDLGAEVGRTSDGSLALHAAPIQASNGDLSAPDARGAEGRTQRGRGDRRSRRR
ncbi:hypothetical protein HN371_00375 [Candidatus Poribacteria bacterium]|jgi:hypothetical protein|nr:hypothetical protein [Candidatus Poribacteria bacterium]